MTLPTPDTHMVLTRVFESPRDLVYRSFDLPYWLGHHGQLKTRLPRVVSERAARFGYPELPRGIPPSYAAARAVLPATVAKELCLTGRIVEADEAQRLGIVREVAPGDVVERALALAGRIAELPRQAILETKRRTLLERRHLWGFLFEEEERVFRRALLGETEPANA